MTTLSFSLPDHSFLFRTLQRCHYMDHFQEVFTDRKARISLTEAVQTFFTASPAWVRSLLAIRNHIATLLGLRPLFPQNAAKQTASGCPLETLPLQIFSRTENEIVMGEDDRHLSFRISFYLEHHPHHPHQKTLAVTTMVQFHNTLGRIYFSPVRSFHKRLVPALLTSMARELDRRNQ